MAFNMPEAGTWEQRGGWVVRALMPDLDLKMLRLHAPEEMGLSKDYIAEH